MVYKLRGHISNLFFGADDGSWTHKEAISTGVWDLRVCQFRHIRILKLLDNDIILHGKSQGKSDYEQALICV